VAAVVSGAAVVAGAVSFLPHAATSIIAIAIAVQVLNEMAERVVIVTSPAGFAFLLGPLVPHPMRTEQPAAAQV
jgi:hypothetical protein